MRSRYTSVEHSCCFTLFRSTRGAFPAQHAFTPNIREFFNELHRVQQLSRPPKRICCAPAWLCIKRNM
jgi:hypothetical protein